jgi:hypothetical protein
MKKVAFQGRVFKWSGEGAWYFVAVDKKLSEKLREMPKTKKRGFNSIKVRAKLGKQIWDTSLFPTKEGPYLIAIKKSVRYEELIDEGDTVKISCTLL